MKEINISQRYRPYHVYKNSGIGWLGEIPVHWEVSRVKFLGRFLYGASLSQEDREEGNVPVFGSNGIVGTHSSTLTEAPCIVIGRKGSFGKINYSEIPCYPIDTTYYIDPSSAAVNIRWLFYALASLELDTLSRDSAVPGLNRELSHNQWLPKCSPIEQRTIASFLDHETAKIDILIEKNQRLIELLQEKRTALITHAVTKGLNPDAPMRDSGIEWLGEIPAHWGVYQLRHLGEAIIGLTYDPSDVVEQDDEGVLVLRASNISNGRLAFEDNVFVKCTIPDRMITRLDDILICSRSGSRNLIGKNARIDMNAEGLSWGVFMTVFRSTYNHYLFHVFNSMLFDYQSGAFQTSTINQLTVKDLKSFAVPVPPRIEQSIIAAFLDDEIKKIDTIIDKVREAYDRLRDFRSALISSAVTGKIDVRREVA